VAALGSINADLVLRIPGSPEGTLVTDDIRLLPGGKAANVAVLVRRLGLAARLLGTVGDDGHATVALAGPRDAGVDVADVATITGATGFAVVLVEPDGAKTIVRVPHATGAGDTPLDVAAAIRRAPTPSVLVVDAEVPRRIVDEAIVAAREAGALVVVDPAPPDAVDDELIAAADVITPDHLEAGALTGMDVRSDDAALDAAEQLCELAGWATVKLRDGGCAVVWADGRALLRAPPVDAVDSNGAGDAFAGGLAWALACGADELAAAVAGVAASTCAVAGRGAQPPLPDEPALRQMMERVTIERR
jgi:ribokinase